MILMHIRENQFQAMTPNIPQHERLVCAIISKPCIHMPPTNFILVTCALFHSR